MADVDVQETDKGKRNFLKLAGIVGLGVVASQMFPKSAQAYVMGSAPTSAVVGVKNSSNTRIDPATEGGNLATIAGKDFATQTTLAFIKTNSDKFNFDGESLKVTGMSLGGLSDTVKTLNISSTQVGLASEDSVILLRRMVKLMESKATVDVANRRRVTFDAWMNDLNGPLETGTATGVQSLVGLVDTTKGGVWVENQWAYYAVKITAGTGIDQVRMIGSNTRDTLTLQLPWTTQPDGTSVYGIYDVLSAISVTGDAVGTQSLLTLTDTTKAWTTNQWANFVVRITDRDNGGTQIRLVASNTATVLTYQYAWTPRLGVTPVAESGTATGVLSHSTFTDTTKVWVTDSWANYAVTITSGAGADQTRIIASNTDTVLTLQNDWLILPDSTSTYDIRAVPTDGVDSGTASANQPTTLTFTDSSKAWTTNQWANFLIKIRTGAGANQIRHIASNTATILTLSAEWTIQPDATSTYAIYALPSRTYTITAMPSPMTDVGTSVGVMRVGTGTDSTIGSVSSVAAIGLYSAQQRFGDVSHRVYNNSIRSQLTFN